MLKSYHSKSKETVYNYYVTTLITLKEEFLIKNTELVLFDLDNTLFLFNDLWLIPKNLHLL